MLKPTRLRISILLVLTLACGVFGDPSSASAQRRANWPDAEQEIAGSGPVESENVVAADSEATTYTNLFNVVKKGGLFMIPIFACSFILMVFVFERAISLRRARVIPGPFVKKLFHQLREGKLDRDQALELCQENPSTVSDVLSVAIRKWGRPAVEMEQAIMDAGERAANVLRRYIRLFNAISTIGPLLGLLGTVFGMIHMFNELSVAGTVGRTELFAGGISEALLTTASGLSVAIPALCFYLIFLARVDRLLMDIDAAGQELIGIISSEALQEDRQSKLRTKARPPTAA